MSQVQVLVYEVGTFGRLNHHFQVRDVGQVWFSWGEVPETGAGEKTLFLSKQITFYNINDNTLP